MGHLVLSAYSPVAAYISDNTVLTSSSGQQTVWCQGKKKAERSAELYTAKFKFMELKWNLKKSCVQKNSLEGKKQTESREEFV